jgi:transcriptional regulator of acetoin/glycerol metabolism
VNTPNPDPFAALLEAPAKSNRQVAAAWERFVATGDFGNQPPRQTIAESWRRCRDLGVRPEANRAPSQLDVRSIERILATAALGLSGREVLQGYEFFLRESGHVIVLADASGNILHVAGQQGTQEQLERINFMPGGMWAEDICGPNGVGTPLKLGRPEVVLGTEHFCQGWQPWVCYGSPVRDPESGEIIGVVDITGPVRLAQIETLGLTVAIAQAVEQRLQLRELRRREALHDQFLAMQRRWPGDAMILLSRSGRILDANMPGLTLLNAESEGAQALERNRRLIDVAPTIARGLNGLRLHDSNTPSVIEKVLPECGLHMRMEALRDAQSQVAGYLMVLGQRRPPLRTGVEPFVTVDQRPEPASASPTSLRDAEDEMIRRTLAECNGEISRAARRLGIARSTLYRRLKRNEG